MNEDYDVARRPAGAGPSSARERLDVTRIIDASANRAAEGLRVAEEYMRFVLDDPYLSGLCKRLRHDLASALSVVPSDDCYAARDTLADVGTALQTPQESRRPDAGTVAVANFKRVEQSLRCLEEYGKVIHPGLGEEIESLRYRTYTLERAVMNTAHSLDRMSGARLCVLIDGGASSDDLDLRVRPLLEAGVDMLQLRDKTLSDQSLIERARRVQRLTRSTRTLLIINDRPDLACLAEADGVHVGQDDLTVKDARGVVGPKAIVGVSTHSIGQARQAVLDGASYIGVGPTFGSQTKTFVDPCPGLDLLREVSGEIRLPAFAIGGICLENLPDVLESGITRIAVSHAVWKTDDPKQAADTLLTALAAERPPLVNS